MDLLKLYVFHFLTRVLLVHGSCSDFFVSRVFLWRDIDTQEGDTTCLDFVTMFMNETIAVTLGVLIPFYAEINRKFSDSLDS
jgi:hypothetical protein